MATALAPRIYGLDAIGAAAGTEEAQAFARRLYERVADKDLAAASAEQRAAGRALPARVRPAPPARRRQGPGVQSDPAEHGFESRHTIVQIVNDDMPFLVDSIANELNRRELGVHLLAHPVMPVRRDLDGDLLRARRCRRPARRSELMMQIEIDRQADAGAARRSRRGAGPRAGRSAARRRRLEGDAAGRARRGRGPGTGPHAIEEAGIPALARGQSLHLPRPSPLSLRRGRRAARRPPLRGHAGLGAGHPAARRRPAVRRGAGRRRGDGAVRARAAAAADRQDRPRIAGPSPRRDGLRHRQDPRRWTAESPASGASPASSPRPPITRRRSRCRCCAAGSNRCWCAPG